MGRRGVAYGEMEIVETFVGTEEIAVGGMGQGGGERQCRTVGKGETVDGSGLYMTVDIGTDKDMGSIGSESERAGVSR